MEKDINLITLEDKSSFLLCDKPNNVEEFCNILTHLVDSDLSVLHQVLMVEDETEQIKTLRKQRSKITYYANLYNAYTARVLVLNPVEYVKSEIISRFDQSIR
jgi:hypothetical protein